MSGQACEDFCSADDFCQRECGDKQDVLLGDCLSDSDCLREDFREFFGVAYEVAVFLIVLMVLTGIVFIIVSICCVCGEKESDPVYVVEAKQMSK